MGSEPLAAMHLGLFNTDGGTKAIWITEVCMQLNQLDSLFKVYPVTIPLHVSVLLAAHHQEVTMNICNNWYVLYVLGHGLRAWM
jgi:hypothetical protein